MTALSLYAIEDALLQLAEARDVAESEGDAEAVAVMDREIAAYLTREAAKVDSYAGLIRRRIDEAAICKARGQELLDRAKRMQAHADRLKASALEVMQRFGVKELRTPENTMRVQGNGGVEPLEITSALPDDKLKVSVTMSFADFRRLIHRAGETPECTYMISDPEPWNEMIRAALKRGETIPGAKLLERGSHLRLS